MRRNYQPSSEMQRQNVEQVRNAKRRMSWRVKWARYELNQARERVKQWRK